MPIYEYHCQPCDHTFETLIRGRGDVPRCPQCGEIEHLAKQFSVPAAAHTAGKASALPICESGSVEPCGPGHCRTGMCGLDG